MPTNCSTDVQTLYINEDNLIRWDKAYNYSTGQYINSGSGSWELKDADGAAFSPPRTGSMSYVAASNGRWHGVIDKADVADLTEGATYYVEVTLADGAGADGFRRIQHVAQYHGGQ